MATLREAIKYAQQNPNDPKNTNLYRAIRNGSFDEKAIEEGIDISHLSRSYTTTASKPKTGYAERREDIQQIGEGISERRDIRREKVADIEQAQAEGKQGRLRSGFQKLGQVAGFASDVIGETIIGAGKAFLPEKAERGIKKGAERVVGDFIENNSLGIKTLMDNYEELKRSNPKLARDVDALTGIGQLALDVGTSGLGGRLAKKGLETGVKAGAKTAGKIGAGARRVGFELEGALTGTSQETLEAAFQAAKTGGKQLDELTKSLRGEVTPERLVSNVREASGKIASRRSADFKKSLAKIGSEPVDTSGVLPKVVRKLEEFGINVTDDGLDFSRSRFRRTPQAQTKIKEMFDEIESLEDANLLGEVDITRQALRELKLTGDDASARSANALINDAIDNVRSAGAQVDGYEDMLIRFADDSDFLEEVTKSLASGDKKTIDTTYRRIATALKTNNERRMRLIQELDEATDGAILSGISGQQLSEALPRGLFRQIGAGLAGAGIVQGSVSASLLPALVFASPRVAGEFVRALGLAANKTKIIIKAIEDARKVVDKINIPVPITSPAVQSLQGDRGTQ